MKFYTMNSGHMVIINKADISDDAIQRLKPLVLKGSGPLPSPFTDYFVKTTIDQKNALSLFTLLKKVGNFPITHCGLSWGSQTDILWKELDKTYQTIFKTKAPLQKPNDDIWLVSIIFPVTTSEEMFWIADFEKCMAYTILNCTQ